MIKLPKEKERYFLSASESDRSCKKTKPNDFSSRKKLFGNFDNANDSGKYLYTLNENSIY